jgi:hypothetical protein
MNSHEPTLETLNDEARYSNKCVERLILRKFHSYETIRPATVDEWKKCIKSVIDHGDGIYVDNVLCYVNGYPDKVIFKYGESCDWLMQWADETCVSLHYMQGELDGEEFEDEMIVYLR